MMRCRLFGHRWRFRAEGPTLRWDCERGCGAGDEKTYDSAERADRYARHFNRRDSSSLGTRFPIPLPQGVWRKRREDS
jgi:hypothetical protein